MDGCQGSSRHNHTAEWKKCLWISDDAGICADIVCGNIQAHETLEVERLRMTGEPQNVDFLKFQSLFLGHCLAAIQMFGTNNSNYPS